MALYDIPDRYPPYLRFMRPAQPFSAYTKDNILPESTIDIQTIIVSMHRMIGLSVPLAYWPDSWQDAWAIEELLRWEGREDEIRRDKYYADFTVDETSNRKSSGFETLVISESTSSRMKSLIAGKEDG